MGLDETKHHSNIDTAEAQKLPQITLNENDWKRLTDEEYDPNRTFRAHQNTKGKPYPEESRIYEEDGTFFGEIGISN